MATEGTEQRKLAAIMFTDMVGYSALAQRDETLALELLEEHRRLLREIFPRHQGQEIKTIGDGFFVEFASALAAVRCAIQIQRVMATRNVTAPTERQIQVRIGIHIGDVVHQDGDVLGNGVNIASRIEPLAEPSGICISMDVERQVRNAIESSVVKLGPAELKNIKLPIDVYRVLLPWQQPPLIAAGALPAVGPQSKLTIFPWAVAMICLAGFLMLLWRQSLSSASRQAGGDTVPVALLRKLELTLPPPNTKGASPTLTALALSPDGKKLAYVNADGLWVRWLDHIGQPVLLASGGQLQVPFWSPWSTDVAYSERNKLMRVAIAGGQPATIWVGSESGLAEGEAIAGVWCADGRIVLTTGSSGLGRVDASGGPATSFLAPAEGEIDFHEPCALPGGRGVAFLVHRKQPANRLGCIDTITVWTPAGGRKDLLQIAGGQLRLPAYSPSGHLVFERRDLQGPKAFHRETWALPLSARFARRGDPFRVADGARLPSISADGTLLFELTSEDTSPRRQMVWVNRSGQITATCGPALPNLREPRLSPDERQVAFSSGRAGATEGGESIWTYDLLSGAPLLLNRSRDTQALPYWFRDARKVLFSRSSHGVSNYMVLVLSVDGVGAEEKLFDGFAFELSRSGKYLQLALEQDARLRYVEMAHPEQTMLCPMGLTTAFRAEISPDDTLLAYSSNETGQEEIYLSTFPGFANKTMISRGAGGRRPHWRPDGSELFYLSLNRRTMMSARVQPQAPHQMLEPAKVFDLPGGIDAGQSGLDPFNPFDVTLDGQRFLMLRGVADESGALPPPNSVVLLVENWFEEFRRNR